MSSMTLSEKRKIASLLDFSNGYIFYFLVKSGSFNKNNTREMILEACGIDIYKDSDFNLSQEKCVRKIWDEKDDYMTGKLLNLMLDYYVEISDWEWEWKEQQDFDSCRQIAGGLLSNNTITLPDVQEYDLKILQKDIENNFAKNTPELVLDRLHTFATQYIRRISEKHGIDIVNNKGDYFSLDTMAANLKNFYKSNDYFSSEFCIIAIQNSINSFAKFNDIRNGQSFAHPNTVLNKIEAEFVIKIVSETLIFIDKIEKAVSDKADEKEFVIDTDDSLPF